MKLFKSCGHLPLSFLFQYREKVTNGQNITYKCHHVVGFNKLSSIRRSFIKDVYRIIWPIWSKLIIYKLAIHDNFSSIFFIKNYSLQTKPYKTKILQLINEHINWHISEDFPFFHSTWILEEFVSMARIMSQ